MKNELLNNLDKVHTTKLGLIRINNNLNINKDTINYIKSIITSNNCKIYIKGKNYYCEKDDIKITINKNNYCIITAHII